MKLTYCYQNDGYLTPRLMLEGNEKFSRRYTFYQDTSTTIDYGKNFIELKSLHGKAVPPESFEKHLKLLKTNGVITAEQAIQFNREYSNQHDILPHIGQVPQKYFNVENYDKFDIWQGSFTQEMIHLKELKNKYHDELAIIIWADYWLAHFQKLELLADLHTAKNYPNLRKQEYQLKNAAFRNSTKKNFIPGESKLIDWISMGLLQEQSHEQSVPTLTKGIESLLQFNPEFKPLLIVAALWAVVGVDAKLEKSHISTKKNYFTIIENDSYEQLTNKKNRGYYDNKHSIFLSQLTEERLRTFFHELVHAIARLINDNDSNLFLNFLAEKLAWIKNAEKFGEEVALTHPETVLNFTHYDKDDFTSEWVARWVEYQYLNPNSEIKVDPELINFIQAGFKQFFEDIKDWCDDFIEETGLFLIKAIKENNFFFNTDKIKLSAEDCQLLNEMLQKKTTIIDLIITKALTKHSPATIIHYLTQEDNGASIYAILQSAARNNQAEIVSYILENATQFNFDKLSPKAIKALNLAVKSSHTKIVELCLKHGIPCNIGIADHTTAAALANKGNYQLVALHYAAAQMNVGAVKLLLQHGALVDVQEHNGDTPLHLAAFNGHPNIAQVLIEANADINKKSNLGFTPLHFAALKGKQNVLKLFLQNKKIEIDCTDLDGNTPLHFAIEKSYLKTNLTEAAKKTRLNCIQLLLDANANCEIANAAGCTPLYLAVKNNEKIVVEWLLKKISTKTLNQSNLTGTTPLQLAIESGQTDIAELLLNHLEIEVNLLNCKGKNALHSAIELSATAIVARILQLPNVAVNTPDAQGSYPLHIVIKNKAEDILALLLNDPKLNVNITVGGFTALHGAVHLGVLGMVKKLLAAKQINPNIPDDNDLTALHHAINPLKVDILKELLTHKDINIEAQTTEYRTPLHLAAMKGGLENVKLLIEHDANINAKDIDLRTPLLIAMAEFQLNVVNWLLQSPQKLELNARDKDGCNVLHYASKYNQLKICETLLATGLMDIQAVDNEGRTALHHAVLRGNTTIVELLLKHLSNAAILAKDKNGKTADDYTQEAKSDKIHKLIIQRSQVNVASRSPASFWNHPLQKVEEKTLEIPVEDTANSSQILHTMQK